MTEFKTAAEFDAEVERQLNEQIDRELAAETQKKRQEIADRLRREAFRKEMERINARHPCELPRTPEQQAYFDRVAEESHRRDAEALARNEERWRADEARRAKALKQRLPRMQIPGSTEPYVKG